MATKNTKIEEEKKIINLPMLDENAQQTEFVSVNEKTYLITRGIDVEVPLSVWEIMQAKERVRRANIRANRKQGEKVAAMMSL